MYVTRTTDIVVSAQNEAKKKQTFERKIDLNEWTLGGEPFFFRAPRFFFANMYDKSRDFPVAI